MEYRAIVLEDKHSSASIKKKTIARLENEQVLVKILYSSLNYKDALSITNKAIIARKFPIVAGLDLAGSVVESKSSRWEKGDRVLIQGAGLGETQDGGMAEFGVFDADICIPIPKCLSAKKVMQIGTAGFTAALSVEKLIKNNQDPTDGPIVVTGASGGVGSFAISFLSQKGYQVIAVSSKDECSSYLRNIGASLNLKPEQLPVSSTALSRPAFAGAIDCLGGGILANLLRHTDIGGNVVSVGMVAGTTYDASVLPHIIRGVNLLGVSSTNCTQKIRENIWRSIAADYDLSFLEKLSFYEISLDDATNGAKDILSNALIGRIIINIGEI